MAAHLPTKATSKTVTELSKHFDNAIASTVAVLETRPTTDVQFIQQFNSVVIVGACTLIAFLSF